MNLVSRLIGAVVRSGVIIVGLGAIALSVIGAIVVIGAFLALPIIAIYLLISAFI